MTDDTNAPAGGDLEAAPVVSAPNLEGDGFSVDQAFEAYQKRINPTAESADEPATAETQSADEADAGSSEAETTSEDEVDEPAKPAIDPPKSWTKDLHEHWASLDPALQERIVNRDREDQAAIKRAFNEVDADRKVVKSEREAAEQARKQYEAQLPALMQTLQDAQQSAFADIRTVDDVTKLANEDPFRYLQWQAHQTKLQAVNAELQRAKDASTKEQQTQWTDFVNKQNALAAEYIPELADSKKSQELTAKAGDLLRNIGFTQEDLNGFTVGEKVSLYDHRIQRLLFNALKFTEVKAAPPKAIPKPVPAVQKPGVAPAKGSNANDVQALRNKLSGTGSVEDAFALYQAKRRRA